MSPGVGFGVSKPFLLLGDPEVDSSATTLESCLTACCHALCHGDNRLNLQNCKQAPIKCFSIRVMVSFHSNRTVTKTGL